MIDVDDALRTELHRIVPVDSRRDWSEVVARAGLKRNRARRRWAITLAGVLSALAVGISTPLGAAIARGFDDFSDWVTGEPGTPASESEREEFEAANAHSWLRFPQGTRLRHLITAKAGNSTVELFGFRSGSSALCLRLKVTTELPSSALECAPVAELRRAGGPARAVIADYHVGKGDKVAWYGIDRIHSAALLITAGVAADGVGSIVLEDDAGRHEVPVSSNGFLYVAEQPDVGQRVKRIWARTDTGLVPVPFAPVPFGYGGGTPNQQAPAAPATERRVSGGRIAWLETHEPRGESLDVLPPDTRSDVLGLRRGNVLFGRVLAPDPDRPVRLIVTLNAHRRDGVAAGLCTLLVTRGGASGGCSPYPGVFERKPITNGLLGGGFGGFVTISGVASDDVGRIEALLADGQRAEVPLKDNAFVVDLPRANLPARLVAYDAEDRVIGVGQPWQDFGGPGSGPARGRATSLIRVMATGGATAELFVGPSTDGGECVYIKEFVDRQHAGVGTNCHPPTWTGPPLQLGTSGLPPRFISGRVRADVETVRISFADGATKTLTPKRGYILWAVPKEHLESSSAPVDAEGLSAYGTVLGRQSLRPSGPATRSRRSSSQD